MSIKNKVKIRMIDRRQRRCMSVRMSWKVCLCQQGVSQNELSSFVFLVYVRVVCSMALLSADWLLEKSNWCNWLSVEEKLSILCFSLSLSFHFLVYSSLVSMSFYIVAVSAGACALFYSFIILCAPQSSLENAFLVREALLALIQ